jgi:hypothetical protein
MMLLVMEQLQLQLSNEKMLQANPISIKLGMGYTIFGDSDK